MTISYKVWDFPALPVSKQLFHVPGAAIEGGFTSGGARIISPDPSGGRSVLVMQLALRFGEWDNPLVSWLMSKTNGQIFRVPLTMTPQIISSRNILNPVLLEMNATFPETDWDMSTVKNELSSRFTAVALEGSNIVHIDMSRLGEILKRGHIIGHNDSCYMVDDISYVGTTAIVTTSPPIRNGIAVNDRCKFRPMFLGTISNGDTFRTTYDAENNGAIQPGTLIFNEAIL